MPVNWASSWKAPTLVAANYQTAPNTTPPNALHTFEVTDKLSPSAVNLCFAVFGPATATVTITLWVYDAAAGGYVPWYSAQTVTYGTVTKLAVPAYAKVYVQITAVANAPTGFTAGVMAA